MSTTQEAKALRARLLRAAVTQDHAAVAAAVEECARSMTAGELTDALAGMAWAAGCFARRLSAAERLVLTGELLNAGGVLAFRGVKL